MPNRWLVKTDPILFSFGDLRTARCVAWNEVRSPLARRHLAAMRRGDEVLVYHSGRERAVVGRARCASGPYPDAQAADPGALVVDLAAGPPLARPVTLGELRRRRALASWALVRIPRLTVLPVPAGAWQTVLALGGGPP